MIKHVVFTDEALAKVFCYDLAATITPAQRAVGIMFYSVAMPHPDPTRLEWAVAVDDSDTEAMAVVTANNYTLVDLDNTWYPAPQAPVV